MHGAFSCFFWRDELPPKSPLKSRKNHSHVLRDIFPESGPSAFTRGADRATGASSESEAIGLQGSCILSAGNRKSSQLDRDSEARSNRDQIPLPTTSSE